MKKTIIAAGLVATLAVTARAADYVTIAASPCIDLIGSYRTAHFDIEPIVEYLSPYGFGSAANVADYVLVECRTNEAMTIGEAVEKLFADKKANRLPRIPIGGATNNPKAQAEWFAFDRWIKHQGPPPVYR